MPSILRHTAALLAAVLIAGCAFTALGTVPPATTLPFSAAPVLA